jgi:prepilin-type N-terminal cleavage/methylation domain-containing protein
VIFDVLPFATHFFHEEANMKSQNSKINNPTSPRGFTIVECLIGLAISAILLAAVAVAFNASVTNYRENEDMFWSVNNARQALARMTSEIRVAGYLAGPLDWYGVSPDTPSNKCTFWTAGHELLSYEFRDAAYATPACRNKLYLIKEATGEEYVLSDDVVAASFDKIYDESGAHVRGVQISLTIRSGGSRRTLSSVAVVRRCPWLVNSAS